MVMLPLNEEQVIELVKQLPPQSKRRVMDHLNAERDAWWDAAVREGEADMKRLASERGVRWDAMSESQREAFVDDLLHEDAR